MAACPPRIGLLPPGMRLASRADNCFVLTLTISDVPKENFRGFGKLFLKLLDVRKSVRYNEDDI